MRVVQISDSHVSATTGVRPPLQAILDWIVADPPDVVVHTGDIVWEDPDNHDDRRFGHDVFADLPCQVVVIPGNHDVGFFEQDRLHERLGAFRSAWGDDRFVIDDPHTGWRLVGLDVYAIGHGDTDEWIADTVGIDAPLAVFVHQPLAADAIDGWQLPDEICRRTVGLLQKGDVRLIASGHRHCAVTLAGSDGVTHVWSPSTTLTGDRHHGGDPSPGCVEFEFRPNAQLSHRFVHL